MESAGALDGGPGDFAPVTDDAPLGATPTVEVDGVAMASGELTQREHFGQQSVELAPLTLDAGGNVRVVVRTGS